MSAVALGEGLGSLTHRGWHPSSSVLGDPQLRQNYITPHFRKCSLVTALKLRFVPTTASRPNGFLKQALCKIAYAGAVAIRLHSPSRFASYVQSSVALGMKWLCGI